MMSILTIVRIAKIVEIGSHPLKTASLGKRTENVDALALAPEKEDIAMRETAGAIPAQESAVAGVAALVREKETARESIATAETTRARGGMSADAVRTTEREALLRRTVEMKLLKAQDRRVRREER